MTGNVATPTVLPLSKPDFSAMQELVSYAPVKFRNGVRPNPIVYVALVQSAYERLCAEEEPSYMEAALDKLDRARPPLSPILESFIQNYRLLLQAALEKPQN